MEFVRGSLLNGQLLGVMWMDESVCLAGTHAMVLTSFDNFRNDMGKHTRELGFRNHNLHASVSGSLLYLLPLVGRIKFVVGFEAGFHPEPAAFRSKGYLRPMHYVEMHCSHHAIILMRQLLMRSTLPLYMH